MEFKWFYIPVNPEPWAIGDLAVGRKNGRVYPYVGRNQQLFNFQQAVKEALGETHVWLENTPIELQFSFWRRRDEYQTHQARTHRKHEADGTNLAKATEDALQGIMFKNDKDVAKMTWEIVEQGPDVTPGIVIAIRPYQPVMNIPVDILALREEEVQSNIWDGSDEMEVHYDN